MLCVVKFLVRGANRRSLQMPALGSPDRILMWVIKNAVRAFHYVKSSDWERKRALVTGHNVLDPFIGCPSVKLWYTFDVQGQPIKSSDVVPFTGALHAKAYAESFPHNLPRIVRVNPKNPQETRFFERDQ
jgi:hypothetical protein